MELNSSNTEDYKQKFEKNRLFALNCILFLTESFYRLTNIFQNLREKRLGVIDFLDRSLIKHHDEAMNFIQEKRLGLVKLRDISNISKEIDFEGFEKKIASRKFKKTNDFQPLNDWELREILSEKLKKNEGFLIEIVRNIKEEEILRYFLKKDEILRILESFSVEKLPNQVNELIMLFYESALNEFHHELMILFEKYRDFICKIQENSEALVLKILYYRPEFDIANVKENLDFSYFENENFKKSVKTRVLLYSELYVLKKMKKISPFLKNKPEFIEEGDLEDEYREELRREIKKKKPLVFEENIKENQGKKPKNTITQGFRDLFMIRSRIGKWDREEKTKKYPEKHLLDDELLSLRTQSFSINKNEVKVSKSLLISERKN